ncbi:hypothetical protein EVAR_15895_1 [Eumeta japonica]|uniref:Uncharacterized protein n=1 Tax=Eumeta variegata TaxID=151549 RepID=A0A4C1UED3_EUMVA|nr:hypothetical protein EVAR_15895_1 [Eumeta japonica]
MAEESEPPEISLVERRVMAEAATSPLYSVYTTSAPPPAKFSDVVGGQHGPVPAAIAAQLHSQIPVYQTRFGVPTTYEVSAPVPSQLAYSEHKMYIDAQSNPMQYTESQGVPVAAPKPLVRLAVRYPQQVYAGQPQQQPIIYVPQQVVYQQGHNVPHLQPALQYPQAVAQLPQAHYNQQPVEYIRSQVQPQVFVQQPQSGVEYAQKTEVSDAPKYAVQAAPKEVRIASENVQEKQIQNTKPSGAVSYVSFTQNPVPAQQAPTPRPYNTKVETLQAPNSIPQVHKPGFAPLILVRVPTPRYYSQPQLLQSAPVPQVHNPNQHPQQYYQPQRVVLQNTPYHPQQPLAVAPTFPPIQYFGKFAPQIFGPGQH